MDLVTYMLIPMVPLFISVVTYNLFSVAMSNVVMSSRVSRALYRFFALFFVPIHELSHLVMAVIFGHKINKVVLFQLNNTTSGYVEHSWNKKSLYQSFGTFFIASAPLLVSMIATSIIFSINSVYINEIDVSLNAIIYIFNAIPFGQLLFLGILCFYCTPSTQDFKNAFRGTVYVSVAIMTMALVLSSAGADTEIIKTMIRPIFISVGVIGLLSSVIWIILFLIGFLSRRWV